jgi:hypothetical protein
MVKGDTWYTYKFLILMQNRYKNTCFFDEKIEEAISIPK